MAIIFSCACGNRLSAKEEHVGCTVRCPRCGREMAVPAGSDQAPNPLASPAEPGQDYDQRRQRESAAGTSKLAIASLILGIASFCFPIAGLVAIVLAILAFVNIGRSDGRLGGRGLAIGGLVTSLISLLILLPAMFYAIHRVREAAAVLVDAIHMRMIGIGIHNYHNSFNHFPTKGVETPPPVPPAEHKPLLSWRVAILPFIDEEQLYKRFHLDEPWDSPHNLQLLKEMPKLYENPSRPAPQAGWTYYQALVGERAIFDPRQRIGFADIHDGSSNTIMIAEAAEAVPWTMPEDMPFDFDPGAPLPRLGGAHRGGFNALFADGTVRFIPSAITPETLRRLIDRRDGSMIDPDKLE